jgi:hypothetical protein
MKPKEPGPHEEDRARESRGLDPGNRRRKFPGGCGYRPFPHSNASNAGIFAMKFESFGKPRVADAPVRTTSA